MDSNRNESAFSLDDAVIERQTTIYDSNGNMQRVIYQLHTSEVLADHVAADEPLGLRTDRSALAAFGESAFVGKYLSRAKF